MSDKEVRLMRGPFSGDWLAVILEKGSDSRIAKKFRFADEDQAILNAALPAEGERMSDDVKAVAKEILDRTEGQIGTHSTDCHKYHLACFAAFVMRNLAASEQTPDFSALLSDEAILAAVASIRDVGPDSVKVTPAEDWEIAEARAALQAAVDAVAKGDTE